MIILLSFVMCFRSIGRFYVNNVYIYLVALIGIYFEKHIDNILCFSSLYNSYDGSFLPMLIPIGKDGAM